jgi:hypothetical protein
LICLDLKLIGGVIKQLIPFSGLLKKLFKGIFEFAKDISYCDVLFERIIARFISFSQSPSLGSS